jgi:hypothetical protein
MEEWTNLNPGKQNKERFQIVNQKRKSKDTQYSGQQITNNDISKLKIDQHEPH